MRTYLGVSLCIIVSGMVVARAIWPCLYGLPWTPFVVAEVATLILAVVLHMSGWRCWTYLRQTRKRLHSKATAVRPSVPYGPLGASIAGTWSVMYIILAWYVIECEVSWWPGACVLALVLFYTVVRVSSSWSFSSSESSSNENALSSGSLPDDITVDDKISVGDSMGEDSSSDNDNEISSSPES
jgi:hypothetical protein